MTGFQYVLALDQGTTSSRAILFKRDGCIAAAEQEEFPQHFPRPGWVEHDPNDIWKTQLRVMTRVIARTGTCMNEIAGIGITNQRETTVVWNRETGNPVYPAIVWQDRRTARMCDDLVQAGYAEAIQQKTGLVMDAYFSATKIKWILDHVQGAREQASQGKLAFGTVDSWLIWNLTEGQVHVTDSSNASRTMLFNLDQGDWDDDLLDWFQIPRSILPRVISSSEVCGRVVRPECLAGGRIAGISGDQQAALFGQGCVTVGMAKNTYGTGCFLLWQTGQRIVISQNRLLATVAWRMNQKTHFALEGSVFMGGAIVQWLRDGLGILRNSSNVESLAASVPSTGGVFLVPAFAGLGAPYWDPYARGAVVGMTRGTTSAHLARAALEAIAFQSADVLTAMQEDTGQKLEELRVDGGASVNNLLMQFQADLLGVDVIRPREIETTALGVAYLAGLSTGFWESQEEISGQWKEGNRFEPSRPREEMDARREDWRRAVERASDWARDAD